MMQADTGILYIVATPIGNLEDITYRAIKILAHVDCIAAEDTRRTRKLLTHYNISKPLVSYHDFNKAKQTPVLIKRLLDGASIALVSDAGTPGISDPGYRLITKAIESKIEVHPIPGPSSLVSALSVSGLPTDRFVFEGYLDGRSKKRQNRLLKLADEVRTIVLFESPHRILKTLEDIHAILGNRAICVARELTKLNQEIMHGTVEEISTSFSERSKIKGEITIVIHGKGK
ncbi:MAG: 16S rRNA (cytidine(1402)-2'-O)-methyltransferase [bacterium]